MMSNFKIAVIFYLTVLLSISGCVSHREVKSEAALGQYNFDYSIESAFNTRVIQVFDDGYLTYVKIFELENVADVLKVNGDKNDLKITFLGGNLISVSGVHEKVSVLIGSKETSIARGEGADTPKSHEFTKS